MTLVNLKMLPVNYRTFDCYCENMLVQKLNSYLVMPMSLSMATLYQDNSITP